jgi:hypothetical protein
VSEHEMMIVFKVEKEKKRLDSAFPQRNLTGPAAAIRPNEDEFLAFLDFKPKIHPSLLGHFEWIIVEKKKIVLDFY